jgi:hypothetical protein
VVTPRLMRSETKRKKKNMKIKTFNNYLDYINSDVNNWSYVTLNDFKKAQNKKVKVYFDKQNNEINVVLTERRKTCS